MDSDPSQPPSALPSDRNKLAILSLILGTLSPIFLVGMPALIPRLLDKLGITGLVQLDWVIFFLFCNFLISIAAVSLASISLSKMTRNKHQKGRAAAIVGLVCGGIVLAWFIGLFWYGLFHLPN